MLLLIVKSAPSAVKEMWEVGTNSQEGGPHTNLSPFYLYLPLDNEASEAHTLNPDTWHVRNILSIHTPVCRLIWSHIRPEGSLSSGGLDPHCLYSCLNCTAAIRIHGGPHLWWMALVAHRCMHAWRLLRTNLSFVGCNDKIVWINHLLSKAKKKRQIKKRIKNERIKIKIKIKIKI